jgi:SPP1 family predicted phage head-tail adaptor
MKAGPLDRRITIEAKTSTVDPDYGTETAAWTTFASRISAQVQDNLPSKSEGAADGIVIATRPARIRIRYMKNITSDMRIIVHGDTDRLMQITAGPAEIGRRDGIELMATEYSTQGGA